MKTHLNARCFSISTLIVNTFFVITSLTIAQTNQRGMTTGETPANVSALPAKAKRWALVIGVDTYKDAQINSLHGAANDAKLLANALVAYAGFPQDQVILLATEQPDERQPTRVNILRRLSNLASVVRCGGQRRASSTTLAWGGYCHCL